MIIGKSQRVAAWRNARRRDAADGRPTHQTGLRGSGRDGAGAASSFSDAAFSEAGASVGSAEQVLAADVVLKVNAPDGAEIAALRDGATLISLISPALKPELIGSWPPGRSRALAMDAVPRISRAQSLDVLSSMANIAGYRAVIEAANKFGRFFTGQVTAAGKVPPAKVLIVGAGVAGLAAVGAAGSLGAIVRATDPRPEVADPIKSLGGEYLSIESPEAEVSATGYAEEWATVPRPVRRSSTPNSPRTSTSSSPPR